MTDHCRAGVVALLAAAAIVAAGLSLPRTAHATFPGANGRIAFERGNETAEHDIYAVNPDGSGELNLTHNKSNNRQIAWSPDGSRIAFFSDGDGSDNYYDIHVAPADGSGPVRVANTGGAYGPSWSPDGESIAFADSYVYAVRANGTYLRNLTAPQRASYPAWSPDGTEIAFIGETLGGAGFQTDVYLIEPDGSGLRRLTDAADQVAQRPSWSPDGKWIAYVSNRDGGCPTPACLSLYSIRIDGTDRRRLAAGQVTYATWAPDGSKIAFQAYRGGPPQIYTIDLDGTDERRLTDSPRGDYVPEWSPDSTRLVFDRSRLGGNDVYVMNRDGSDQRFVTEGGTPQWQPLPSGKDAKRICKLRRAAARSSPNTRRMPRSSACPRRPRTP